MRSKVYKFIRYTKKNGVHGAIKKTREHLAKNSSFVKKNIEVMASIEDIMEADYINHPYKTPSLKSSKDGKLKIGWVLSPLSHGSGGQNTIVRFARYLIQCGHEVVIYIYEGIHPQSVFEAKKILKESFNIDIEVKKISNYEESDAIIATGWETAYPVFNLKTNAHKFYFVQDFEPYFYGLGSKAVLAENTYRMGFYGITAGKWLTHKVSEYGMSADYFNFGVDLDIYKFQDGEKKKKVCFYARPVTERRAFELGVISLDIFHKNNPEYEIEFFGWDVSDYNIPFPFVNRGILSHHELAELYNESIACLVLSLTNVSLLPLELLSAGCIPIMNEGDNNSMVLGENSYIKYSPSSPVQLASELSNAVAGNDIDKNARMISRSVKSLSWEDSYKKVESIIKREVIGL